MKALEFKQKSWHFWLANFGRTRIYRQRWEDDINTDICSYTSAVFKGLITFVIVACLALAGVTLVVSSVLNIVGYFVFDYGLYETTKGFIFFMAILTLALAVLFAVVGIGRGIENLRDRVDNTEPGFVRTAYRSWKDRFCLKITFKAE
jgi:uncharacterized membrane protein